MRRRKESTNGHGPAAMPGGRPPRGLPLDAEPFPIGSEPMDDERIPRETFNAQTMSKEIEFALYYVGECRFNASAAARKIGIPINSSYPEGCRYLKKPEVKEAIRAHLEAHAADVGEVSDFLTRVIRGDVWGERVPLSDRLDAAKTLARVHGMIKSTMDVTSGGKPIQAKADLTRLSVEELHQLAALADKMDPGKGG